MTCWAIDAVSRLRLGGSSHSGLTWTMIRFGLGLALATDGGRMGVGHPRGANHARAGNDRLAPDPFACCDVLGVLDSTG